MPMHCLRQQVHVVLLLHNTREILETFGEFGQGSGVVAFGVIRRELDLVHKRVGLRQELTNRWEEVVIMLLLVLYGVWVGELGWGLESL